MVFQNGKRTCSSEMKKDAQRETRENKKENYGIVFIMIFALMISGGLTRIYDRLYALISKKLKACHIQILASSHPKADFSELDLGKKDIMD